MEIGVDRESELLGGKHHGTESLEDSKCWTVASASMSAVSKGTTTAFGVGALASGVLRSAEKQLGAGLMSLKFVKGLDTDRDGSVTTQEMLHAAGSAIRSAKERAGASLMSLDSIKRLDTNGDGVISAAEIADAAARGMVSAKSAADEAASAIKADATEISKLASEAPRKTPCFLPSRRFRIQL